MEREDRVTQRLALVTIGDEINRRRMVTDQTRLSKPPGSAKVSTIPQSPIEFQEFQQQKRERSCFVREGKLGL